MQKIIAIFLMLKLATRVDQRALSYLFSHFQLVLYMQSWGPCIFTFAHQFYKNFLNVAYAFFYIVTKF